MGVGEREASCKRAYYVLDPVLGHFCISTFSGNEFYELPHEWNSSRKAELELFDSILAHSKSENTGVTLGCNW